MDKKVLFGLSPLQMIGIVALGVVSVFVTNEIIKQTSTDKKGFLPEKE